jgi:PAS domain S-box-containing protein
VLLRTRIVTQRELSGGRIGSFRISLGGDLVAADEATAAIVGAASPSALLLAAGGAPFDEVRAHVRAGGATAAAASFERSWRTPDGERYTRILLAPVRTGAGAVAHFDGLIEEVDPRTCQAPTSSAGLVESLLDGLPSPVFVKDEQHRWVLLNAAMCALMGHPRDALIGKSDFDFFPPEEARVFWEKDDAVFAEGGVNENEELFTDASGRTHVIVTRKTLHVDALGRRFLLGVITDITELREALDQLRASRDELEERVRARTEELSAANALLRDHDARRAAFLDVLGHELRNPISAISTSTSLLERLPEGAGGIARARATIRRQVAHLARLCDDLLDASRLARGKLDVRRRVFELGGAIEDLCEDLRATFQERSVTLSFESGEEAAWVDADETRIAQAVGNVLHNALKFTPAGGRVQVALRRAGPAVQVVVRDTGRGIAPEELSRVFDPFVRAKDPEAPAHGGLGIGLAIARGLVEAHGGSLSARSEGLGRGTEMIVSLPACAEPAPEPPRAPVTRIARDACLVLIDDEADFREPMADLLRLEGYRVEVASSGATGLALVHAVTPDAVLCDLVLPDMGGHEVARRIRADPDARVAAVRLVALSGFAGSDETRRALAAGFDAHVTKPPSLTRLEELLGDAGARR